MAPRIAQAIQNVKPGQILRVPGQTFGRSEATEMVKAVAFFKRRGGMAVDEFQGYWRSRHPEVVTRLPGVRRYVQSHT